MGRTITALWVSQHIEDGPHIDILMGMINHWIWMDSIFGQTNARDSAVLKTKIFQNAMEPCFENPIDVEETTCYRHPLVFAHSICRLICLN